ncbi:type II toxin-antitoxin system RelE/ParE family toxin [Rhizobium sp. TRM95796]|uniref:type II toxin-antitoxin system RelE/ParE family toxin n=1 Tax=Rhizobium sp. TRM95796 TaxID=2979862 RepID=UPI0021E74483|nr:type II toxin-antitoxin system RelE/ParE family toxin [Rhizobium sp. TRM95796]MCV3764624.1 type II toxin-antitoxin system RelE/ParE family toxin [Rhizobium sp. TRM95796]
MARYRLSPRAKRQLQDIWRAIASENEPAADRLILTLLRKFELVSLNPGMGSPRREIGAKARILIEGKYIAIYEPTDYGVEIVVVVHGMRHPSTWLD